MNHCDAYLLPVESLAWDAGQFVHTYNNVAAYADCSLLFAGTRAVGESDDLVAWDTQATVPLPDIHAKNKS